MQSLAPFQVSALSVTDLLRSKRAHFRRDALNTVPPSEQPQHECAGVRSVRRRLRDGGRWRGKHLDAELAAGKREGADVVDETGEVLEEVLGAVARRAGQETPSRISVPKAFDEEAIGAFVAHNGSVERAMIPAARLRLKTSRVLPRSKPRRIPGY